MLRRICFCLLFISIFALIVNSCSGLTTSANPELRLKQSAEFITGETPVYRVNQLNHAVPIKASNGEGNWTLLVYIDGDNNLESSYIDSFLSMSSVGSTSEVSIVVQFDRIPGVTSRYGNWTDCNRFYITKNLTPEAENAIQNLGEVNMGDPNTLTNFVNWAINSYPADSYCLLLMNHGGGSINGVCIDETDGDDWLSLPELSQALSAVPEKMDLLYFDACVMGMIEVAYQISDYADIMLASEEVMYTGEPYAYYLTNLTANPSMSPTELTDVIVSSYTEDIIDYSLHTGQLLQSTLSAVNLSQISNLKTAVDNFAQRLNDSESSYNDEIRLARGQAEGYEGPYADRYGWYMDLYHFAQLIYQYIPNTDIRNDANQVMTLISNAVITEDHYLHPNSHGLSIFFPCKASFQPTYDTYMDNYSTTDFASDTMWDEFIDYHVSITPAKPDFVVVNVYWEPSNIVPGEEVTFYADLANQGTEDEYAIDVTVYIDGAYLKDFTLPFRAGYFSIKTAQWTATGGRHNITWVIDEDNNIDEWDETNNEMTENFMECTLTVQTPYSNIDVLIDDQQYSTDVDGNFQIYVDPGVHSVGTQDSVSLGTGTRGKFVQWADGNLLNPRDVLVEDDLTLTATYAMQYRLFVDKTPSYVGEVSGEDWYDQGTIAVATCTSPVPMTSSYRYVFVNWTGDASGTSTTLEVLMDSSKTVMANYWMQYNVTFKQSGSAGSPHVTVDGVEYQLPYSLWLDKGSSHTFSYESPVIGGPELQYVLSYTSATSPFDVSYARTITGYYTTQFWLEVNTSVSGVTVPGTGWYNSGTSAMCTAPEASGYTFDCWIVDGASQPKGLNPITVIMNAPHAATAQYVATDSVKPSIGGATHQPEEPLPDESVTISVDVTDDLSGVAQVILCYRTGDSGPWIEMDLSKLSGNTYVGEIPSFDLDTKVYYYVKAYDNAGNSATQDKAGEYYSYLVIPDLSDLTIVGLFMLLTIFAAALAKTQHKATSRNTHKFNV